MPACEPVPLPEVRRALVLLAGGEDLPAAHRKAAQFEATISGPNALACTFWWSRTWSGPEAAAIVLHNVGRVGLIFHGPPMFRRHDTLAALLEECSRAALAKDLSLVQAMLEDSADAQRQAYRQAGFVDLAHLVYMQRRLDDATRAEDPPADSPQPQPLPLTYRTPPEFSMERLGQLLLQTYEESLDCPALHGLRQPQDIIASHQASGTYRPMLWRIAMQGDEPIGCVLMNVSHPTSNSAPSGEIVYMGLRKEWRGKGLGERMLREALEMARNNGMRVMYLAADDANIPARRLYEKAGFSPLQRRRVLIRTAIAP
jgi:ribosomal protein S18 acetylase RimI-like enzyme